MKKLSAGTNERAISNYNITQGKLNFDNKY